MHLALSSIFIPCSDGEEAEEDVHVAGEGHGEDEDADAKARTNFDREMTPAVGNAEAAAWGEIFTKL
jgi:hypothetical protein